MDRGFFRFGAIALSLLVSLGFADYCRLDDVVVTGVGEGVRESNLTEKTHIVDSNFIAATGAANTEQLLAAVPGLTVVSHMGAQKLSINGLDGAYTKILINGVPVTGDMGGAFPLQNIPISEIERVEVVRGSASALYGSEAIGGVINIITKRNRSWSPLALNFNNRYTSNIVSGKAWDSPGFSTHTPKGGEYSSWDGSMNGSLQLLHQSQHLQASALYGWYRDYGAVDTIANRFFGDRPFYAVDKEERDNLSIELSTESSPICHLGLSYRYSGNRRTSSTGDSERMDNDWHRHDIGLTAMATLSDNLSLDGYLTIQEFTTERERFSYNFESPLKTESSRSEFPLQEGELKARLRIGESHSLVAGMIVTREGVVDEDLKEGKQYGSQGAFFVQDIININGLNRLLITPALRLSWNSRYESVLIPHLSARLNLSDELFVRISGGRGFRAPTFKDNFRDDWVHTGGIFVLSGNPDLKPEYSWGGNASLGGSVGIMSWEAYGHATRIYDRIVTAEISPDGGVTDKGVHYNAKRAYVNVDSVQTAGADLTLSVQPAQRVRLSATYSYLYSNDWVEVEEGESITKRRRESLLYSRNRIKGDLSVLLPGGGSVSNTLMGTVVWQDEQKLNRDGGVLPSNCDINISARTAFNNPITLSYGVQNLLDNNSKRWNQPLGRTIWAQISVNMPDIRSPLTK